MASKDPRDRYIARKAKMMYQYPSEYGCHPYKKPDDPRDTMRFIIDGYTTTLERFNQNFNGDVTLYLKVERRHYQSVVRAFQSAFHKSKNVQLINKGSSVRENAVIRTLSIEQNYEASRLQVTVRLVSGGGTIPKANPQTVKETGEWLFDSLKMINEWGEKPPLPMPPEPPSFPPIKIPWIGIDVAAKESNKLCPFVLLARLMEKEPSWTFAFSRDVEDTNKVMITIGCNVDGDALEYSDSMPRRFFLPNVAVGHHRLEVLVEEFRAYLAEEAIERELLRAEEEADLQEQDDEDNTDAE